MNAVEFVTKMNILFSYYCEELVTSKLISNRKISRVAISSLLLLAGSIICAILSVFVENIWTISLLLILSILGVSFGVYALKQSKKFILDNFSEYEALVGDKLSNYEGNFIKAYRCDMISKKIQDLNINVSDSILDEMILYFERNGVSIKGDKWWPITLAVAIIFPVWNEYISRIFDFSIGSIAFIFLSVVAIIYLSTIVNGLLRIFYLSKANKYKNLADTLRLVKITSNTE